MTTIEQIRAQLLYVGAKIADVEQLRKIAKLAKRQRRQGGNFRRIITEALQQSKR